MSDSDQDKAKEPVKLVHYTTAEAAYSILSQGQIWMRRANLMNDISEIFHGCSTFRKILEKKIDAIPKESLKDKEIKEKLKKTFDGLFKELQKIRPNAYVTSFSNISEEEQKKHLGRLSMWRAYGGKAGVAIVFNELFCKNLQNLQKNTKNTKIIVRDVNYCHSDDPETWDILLKDYSDIYASIPFIKHRGFKEETEWRLVMINPADGGVSTSIKNEFKMIRDIPQRIYIYNFDPIKCIDYIIIGPTLDIDHAYAIQESFEKITYNNSCVLSESRIHLSKIPLRMYG